MNFRQHAIEELDLNITPLIDVVFLLLIFFMVSTTFQKETALQLQLPQASEQQQSIPTQKIEVVINAQGGYFVNGRELKDSRVATVRDAINKMARGKKDTPLVLRADALAPHQAFITAMDAASQLGMVKFSIAAAQN
ncbi:biopolymer transporter [Chromatiales bacterium (ex Bugula neritina AB1)]|nr:biopolymer transporter [Chromatiales bacterium (ex Bugula neritina AB1)]